MGVALVVWRVDGGDVAHLNMIRMYVTWSILLSLTKCNSSSVADMKSSLHSDW